MANLTAKSKTPRQYRRFANKAIRHNQRTYNAVLTKLGNIRATNALSVLEAI